ncbi:MULTISPECIES: hypothetical protein [unclassified Streptomyces]|uniref:hypothetical protein n=1 Tax=unclassified Streptomyces TaxID=2593676 RepID=UPI0004C630A6|nr:MULTISPECIES: hypothetical protein [unclassified Streptomyces]
MTPWQRALRATGLVVALGAGAVVAPYGTGVSYGAVSSVQGDGVRAHDALADDVGTWVGARATPSAPGEPSRAGSRAGEGRERPGRPEVAEPDTGDAATAVTEEPRETAPVPSASTEEPVRDAHAHADRSVGPVLRILPLGSGLVLIGLGLGLAFFALRLRRV